MAAGNRRSLLNCPQHAIFVCYTRVRFFKTRLYKRQKPCWMRETIVKILKLVTEFEKFENLKKTQEISEFDFLAISVNMKKTQENRCDCLNWTNLKISLHFWKIKATFFDIYCTTRKSEKNRVILRFLVFQKSEKLNFGLFVFSEFRTLQESRITETYHWLIQPQNFPMQFTSLYSLDIIEH